MRPPRLAAAVALALISSAASYGTLCAENEHVEGHVCVACPEGTTNGADDDASGEDTNCDATATAATLCAEWEHIAPGCVDWHNMGLGVITGLSVAECKARCAATD